PGINISGASKDARGADEIESQIMISRAITDLSPGVVHWSISPLLRNDSLKTRLRKGVYKNQALVPSSNWLGESKLKKPKVTLEPLDEQYGIVWNTSNKDQSFKTVVYYQYGNVWEYRIIGDRKNSLYLNKETPQGKLSRVEVA